MQAPPAQAPTPFLQKFHGKQQKINRDGILQLLNEGRAKIRDSGKHQGHNKVKALPTKEAFSIQLKSGSLNKAETPQKQSSKLEKSIYISQQLKGSQSQRKLDSMAFHLSKRNEFKPFAQLQLKLPPISRSNSQNSKLPSRNSFNPNVEIIQSDRSHRNQQSPGSFYSKNSKYSDRASRQIDLDEYVLKHMEFLEKFESQLISSRLSRGLRTQK